MPIAAILSILATLLPEIIQLAHSWDKTPEEKRQDVLKKIRSAFQDAEKNPGDTSAIEDLINK